MLTAAQATSDTDHVGLCWPLGPCKFIWRHRQAGQRTCSCTFVTAAPSCSLSQKVLFCSAASGTHLPSWHTIAAVNWSHGSRCWDCSFLDAEPVSCVQALLLLHGWHASLPSPVQQQPGQQLQHHIKTFYVVLREQSHSARLPRESAACSKVLLAFVTACDAISTGAWAGLLSPCFAPVETTLAHLGWRYKVICSNSSCRHSGSTSYGYRICAH